MTTSQSNRSVLESMNSLKKQLVSAVANSNDQEIKEILERLKRDFNPTEELIRATKIGITIGKQRQNPNPEIAKLAKSIVNQWRHVVKKDPGGGTSTQKTNRSTTPPTSTPATHQNPKSPSLSSSQHLNLRSPQPAPKSSASAHPPPSSLSTTTGTSTSTVQASNLPSSSSSHPSSTNQIKRTGTPRSSKTEDPSLNFEVYKNDKVRNGSFKAVFDALIFDSDAPADLVYDRAKSIEYEVNRTHDSNGYKNKMRSLIFNLRDKNNPGLRESVVSGEISASKLCTMGPQDMASEERKAQDRKLAEENLFKARGAGPQQAETDAFRCARCGQRKCTYYQMQTRSADEPMTTFVTCVNCNARWKFS